MNPGGEVAGAGRHDTICSEMLGGGRNRMATSASGYASQAMRAPLPQLSPRLHWTWPTIEAQGFRACCDGLFFSFPALSCSANGMRVEVVQQDAQTIDGRSHTALMSWWSR